MKFDIIEPSDEDLEPMFTDPPLKPHGDIPIDDNGQLIEQPVAKSFEECLQDLEE